MNSLLKTVSINAPRRLKLSVRHCKLLNYLKRNLGSAQINAFDLFTEPYARGLKPSNIAMIPGGQETTVTEVLETEQVKEVYPKRNYVIS